MGEEKIRSLYLQRKDTSSHGPYVYRTVTYSMEIMACINPNTNITGFEILNTICTRNYFYKFARNCFLLTHLLSMVVMVIGYLDIEDASNFQFNGELMKYGFINHLEQWHQRVRRWSIINHIESYLVDRKNILSKISFIDASRDAQRYIIDIRNFVIKDMRDFTVNEFLETKYQIEMMSIMRCSFYQTKSSAPEFGYSSN